MQQDSLTTNQELRKRLLKALIEPITTEVREQKKYLKKTDELFLSYVDRINRIDSKNGTSKYINETTWLEKELFDQLETEFPSKEESSIYNFHESFFQVLNSINSNIPEVQIEQQNAKRFIIQKEDKFPLQLLKSFKNLFFRISKLPFHFQNFFRKEKLPLKYWSRKIPEKAMYLHYFGNRVISESLYQFKELQQLKCNSREIKWAINKDINSEVVALFDKEDINFDELKDHLKTMSEGKRIEKIITNFNSKLASWKKGNEQLLDQLISEFLINRELVGTIELNEDFYSNSKLENQRTNFIHQFNTILNGWRNTQYAQIDDFQIDLELYQVKYHGLMQYYLLQNSCQTRINSTTEENIHNIKSELDHVISAIEKTKDVKSIRKLLDSEKEKLKHYLGKKSVPQAILSLYENNFPNLIERLEHKLKTQVSMMRDRRIIYSRETYDSPIPKTNLSHFNPKELVEIDLINPFSNNTQLIKTKVIQTLQQAEEGLKDLIEIVDYNLDSAKTSTNDQLNLNEIKLIAKEGLERACLKTENIELELRNISILLEKNLKTELDKLNTNLLKLTVNENITNLRLQLAKARAIEKTEAYKKELINKVRNFVPILIRFAGQKWNLLNKISIALQEKIGLIDSNINLTTELSDFLSQTESATQKLPFVYRRLYEIKPLEEEVFFEGRKQEIKQLDEAFSRWEESKVSSAVIIGEKGSGTSSLLNFFLRKHNDATIIRHQLKGTIYTKNDFSKFFDSLLTNEQINSFDEIVNFLNEGRKKIIVLEDIQSFYLKKPHGFEAINLLFELISQTAKNIFWLIGTTTFTWNYLQRTIAIERYIKYKVDLSPLTGDQIINLIMSRHRVSGYNLKFKSPGQTSTEWTLLGRKKGETTQENIKKVFFEELNSFAQSNISLALLYWLRSTISFEENTVVIGKIKNIKFVFLNSLDTPSIFTLHTILLHDNLTIQEHAEVFHQEEKRSRMTLMVLEDEGILKSENGVFTINQLIYRQVVNVLKNKNLIH